jgi:hypothetical protein
MIARLFVWCARHGEKMDQVENQQFAKLRKGRVEEQSA